MVRNFVRRMRRSVQGEVQPALAEECVQPGVPHLLQRVQVRPRRHRRQQGDLRQVLH